MKVHQITRNSQLAQSVRMKELKCLTQEEHQFLSIDCKLFPELYQPGFKPFPRYDLKLTTQSIQSISQVSPSLQLAIGYLLTEIEKQAHYIVNKYYDRNIAVDEPYSEVACFDQGDIDETDIKVFSMKSNGKELNCAKELRKLLSSESNEQTMTTFMTVLVDAIEHSNSGTNLTEHISEEVDFPNIEEMLSSKNCLEHCKPFISLDDTIQIYETSSVPIEINEKKIHRFIYEDDDTGKKISSMMVSIVCHGMFNDDDGVYKPAHLSASLSRRRNYGPPEAIGCAPYDLQVINTEKNLGRIIIKFNVEETYRTQSTNIFEIQIYSQSACQHSIDVTCKVSYFVNDVLMHKLCDYFIRKKEIRQHEQSAENMKLDHRVVKRKICLLNDLIEESETLRVQCEKEIDSKEFEFEVDTQIEYQSGMQAIKVGLPPF